MVYKMDLTTWLPRLKKFIQRQNGLPDKPHIKGYTQKVAKSKSKRIKMISETAPMNLKGTVGALASKTCFGSIEKDDYPSQRCL